MSNLVVLPAPRPIIGRIGPAVHVVGEQALAMVPIRGDAMTPTMYPGDQVLVDRAVTRVGRDALYAFRIAGEDEVMVARCMRQARTGLITVRRDNRLYADDEDVRDDDLEIFGRVVWLARQIDMAT